MKQSEKAKTQYLIPSNINSSTLLSHQNINKLLDPNMLSIIVDMFFFVENLEVLYQTEIDELRDLIKSELLALAASPSTEGKTVIIIDALDQV